jgi:hypothetical protein
MTKPARKPSVLFSGLAYAAEKLGEAVDIMATSDLPMRQRLRDAHFEFCAVQEEDFPKGVRADWRALMARMTWAADQGAGTIAATLGVVSGEECRRLAQLIVDLSGTLEMALQDALIDEAVERTRRDCALARRRRTLAAKRSAAKGGRG